MSTFPKILHENRLDDATPVADTTFPGDFDVLNLRDFRPYTFWKPKFAPVFSENVDIDSAKNRDVDYILIMGHDLFSSHCFFQLLDSTSADFSSGVTAVASSNYIDFPDDFANSVWTKRGACVVTPDDTVAPDGTFTADKISGIAVVGVDDIFQSNTDITPTGNRSEPSIYIKRTTTTGVLVVANPQSNLNGEWRIDLSLLADKWERITRDHTAVTVTNEFTQDTNHGIHLYRQSGASAISAHFWRANLNAFTVSNPFANAHKDVAFLVPMVSRSFRYRRLTIRTLSGSAIPSIAIAAFGVALEIPASIQEGFDPLGRELMGQTNFSIKGNPLGRVIDFEQFRERLRFTLLPWTFLRDTWTNAWSTHLRSEPFGFAWDPDNHADEVYLVNAGNGYSTPHRAGSFTDLEFEVSGVAP